MIESPPLSITKEDGTYTVTNPAAIFDCSKDQVTIHAKTIGDALRRINDFNLSL